MSTLTETEKGLLTDLVQMAVHTRKLLNSGRFSVEDIGEIAILDEMTTYVLTHYVKQEDDNGKQSDSST